METVLRKQEVSTHMIFYIKSRQRSLIVREF